MKNLLLLAVCLSSCFCLSAQESFEEYKKRVQQDFLQMKEQQTADFENYRRRVNLEFAEYVAKSWEAMRAMKGEMPKMKPKPKEPIIYEEPKKEPERLEPIEIPDVAVIPLSEVQKQNPPIKLPEIKIPNIEKVRSDVECIVFDFFGTSCSVHWTNDMKFQLKGNSEKEVARVLKNLAESKYEYMLYDCVKIVSDLQLNGWGMQQFCSSLAERLVGKGDDAVVLQTFLLTQLVYDARICLVGNKLKMMAPATVEIAAYSYITLNGKKYYIWDADFKGGQSIYSYKENMKDATRALDFGNCSSIKFDYNPTEMRTVKSEKFSNIMATVSVNRNLIDFYETMPIFLNDDWVMYAREPMESVAKESLLGQLKPMLVGLTEKDAANKLLDFVQTGFEYKTDGDQFGREKPFFKEEMFFYPYCDCEDRSFLFSYLMEKLLGLKTVLVSAPGHVFVAVHFNDDIKGDCIDVEGDKYLICDPTYIGSHVGMCMPSCMHAKFKIYQI